MTSKQQNHTLHAPCMEHLPLFAPEITLQCTQICHTARTLVLHLDAIFLGEKRDPDEQTTFSLQMGTIHHFYQFLDSFLGKPLFSTA